jgi:hypothetical protein
MKKAPIAALRLVRIIESTCSRRMRASTSGEDRAPASTDAVAGCGISGTG